MPEPAATLFTRVEVAAAFGVHPATVVTWDEQGMPCAQRGRRGQASRYALRACVEWFVHRELLARGVTNGDRLDPLQERGMLDRRRREAIEFTTAIKQGEYVLAFTVERAWASRIVLARDALRGMPSRLKLRIPTLTANDLGLIAEEIVHALNELADRQPPHADDAAPD